MQIAARRVLQENQRLRAFLRDKGISDAELELYTGSGGASPAGFGGGYEDGRSGDSSAAKILEDLIGKSAPCCADDASGQLETIESDNLRNSGASSGVSSPSSSLARFSGAGTPVQPLQQPRQYQQFHPQPIVQALTNTPPIPAPQLYGAQFDSYTPYSTLVQYPQPQQQQQQRQPNHPRYQQIPHHQRQQHSPLLIANQHHHTRTPSAPMTVPATNHPSPTAFFTDDIGADASDLLPPGLHAQFLRGLHNTTTTTMKYEESEGGGNMATSQGDVDGDVGRWIESGWPEIRGGAQRGAGGYVPF